MLFYIPFTRPFNLNRTGGLKNQLVAVATLSLTQLSYRSKNLHLLSTLLHIWKHFILLTLTSNIGAFLEIPNSGEPFLLGIWDRFLNTQSFLIRMGLVPD